MSEGGNEEVRTQLERAIVRDQDLDPEIATDWMAVDGETWERLDRGEPAARGAKGYSPRKTA
jgi:hypothetical protein